MNPDGGLSATPVVNSEPGAVPFAIAFDPGGDLVIAEAGPNALATFALNPSGTVTQLAVAGTGAGCPEYLAQSRATIAVAGRVTPDDLTEQMQGEFIDLYRRWQHEGDAEDQG